MSPSDMDMTVRNCKEILPLSVSCNLFSIARWLAILLAILLDGWLSHWLLPGWFGVVLSCWQTIWLAKHMNVLIVEWLATSSRPTRPTGHVPWSGG